MSLADEFKSIPEAAKLMSGPVFQQWLKLRRQGADQFFTGWRQLPERDKRRVRVLDLGAALKARMN